MAAAVHGHHAVGISDAFPFGIALPHVLLFPGLLYNHTSGCQYLAPGGIEEVLESYATRADMD